MASKVIIAFAFVCIFKSSIITRVMSAPPSPPPPSPPVFAFYYVALQWSMALCHLEPCTNKQPVDKFRLHGLWPAFADGSSYINCPGQNFSGNAIKHLRQDLLIYWPSFLRAENKFWEQQWVKHGRCSGLSLVDYFTKARDASKNNYNLLYTALSKLGIRPGPGITDRYSIAQYRDAVDTELSAFPHIKCQDATTGGTEEERKFLVEIHLCVSANLTLLNCPRQNYLSGCGPYQETSSTKARFYLSYSA